MQTIEPIPTASSRPVSRGLATLCTLAACLAAVVAWSGRSANTDLYMALAGGRDVVQGKLGHLDEWSYLTAGRVWINQSWLTHWALYRIHESFGQNGLLLARTLLIAAMLTGMICWLRQLRIAWPAALLSVAIAAAVLRSHLMLRGNLLSLTIFPWLLVCADYQRRKIFSGAILIAVLLTLWMQLHGGFLLAFVALIFFLMVDLSYAVRSSSRVTRQTLFLLTATLLGAFAGTWLNPFHLETWRQGGGMAAGSEWRTISEWRPLFQVSTFFSDLSRYFWELTLYLIFAATTLITFWRIPRHFPQKPDPLTFTRYAILTCFLILVSLVGKRFVSFAVIELALPLAAVLHVWLELKPANIRRIAGAAACALAVLIYPTLILGYSVNHPFYPAGETTFERQVEEVQNPVAAATFMRDNHIVGPIFHTYELEDYLYWAVPGIKVGCGGRAQQIYTAEDLKQRRDIDNVNDLSGEALQRRQRFFDDYHIAAILLPSDTHWPLITALIERGQWKPAYFDGDFCLLVREGGAFGSLADDNAARFPNEISKARTRAMIAAMSHRWSRCVEGIEAAQLMAPHSALYNLIDLCARDGQVSIEEGTAFYEAELERLAGLPTQGANSAMVLDCRASAARRLARLRAAAKDSAGEQRAITTAQNAEAELKRLAFRWQL